MGEYTSISINKKTKEMLDLLKNGSSYDKLLNKLAKTVGGAVIDDTIEIQRDSIAFTLNYWDKTSKESSKNDITFQELKFADVGALFIANPSPESDEYINSIAELVYKNGDDVVLFVEEVNKSKKGMDSISSIVHVNLF